MSRRLSAYGPVHLLLIVMFLTDVSGLNVFELDVSHTLSSRHALLFQQNGLNKGSGQVFN